MWERIVSFTVVFRRSRLVEEHGSELHVPIGVRSRPQSQRQRPDPVGCESEGSLATQQKGRFRGPIGGRLGDTTLRLAGGNLGDQAPSKPSALSRNLSRALNMTVPTVIAGQTGETYKP